jgi:CTP:molybdopterin cytidylyltransferase MocA
VVVLGRDADAILAAEPLAGLPLPVRAVMNLEDGSEQLRSLQIGLAALAGAEHDTFFIHPVDYPLVVADDYRRLLAARGPGGAAVHILSFARRRGHPVLCDRAIASDFLALPPDRMAREVFERRTIAYVETPNPGVIEDMDTPEDYQRLLAAYRSRAPGTSR